MTQNPLFAVLLTPHRSLSANGVRWVVAFTAVLCSIPAITFYALGAWPIVGFMGLDVLLVYWALTRSLRDKDAFEEITLWPDALDIRQVSARGRETTVRFNPFFVRFSAVRDHEGTITALRISTRERVCEIGKFLNADDKARFARAFGDALGRARR